MILVVDDQTDVAAVVVRLLQRSGYHAESVNSGPTALRFLQHIRPQAVLLDLMMPGMDGLDVLRRIRENPHTHDLPVIIFSAHGGHHHRLDEAAALGATAHLVKSLADVWTLRSSLDHLLRPEHAAAEI